MMGEMTPIGTLVTRESSERTSICNSKFRKITRTRHFQLSIVTNSRMDWKIDKLRGISNRSGADVA